MDWPELLCPVQWCVLFIILGFLVRLIELASGSYDLVLFIAYYGCAIAALVSLLFFVKNISKAITEMQEPVVCC
jgi:hypothetical protein